MKKEFDRGVFVTRREYSRHRLGESAVAPDPIMQFRIWFEEALDAKIEDANAMSLATVSATGMPSVRTVLLKEADDRGFVFYTNYQSRKGRELTLNPSAALLFYWKELERQIRIEGTVERVLLSESESYFHSRPRASQISALASEQSAPIAGRAILENRVAELDHLFEGKEVPLPPSWGGYRLAPVSMEFWQGRPNRLHDRIAYFLENGSWIIRRLAP